VEALKIGADDFRTKPLDADAIENALLKLRPSQAPQTPVPSLDLVEWEHLQRVMHDCQNNISQAARILGINRRSLQRKLSKYPPQS
jgi:two-component system response regulator RegA